MDGAGTGRITDAEALEMLRRMPTAELMGRADAVRRARHGRRAYHVHSHNLNPSNRCVARCALCSFWRADDAPDAYLANPRALGVRYNPSGDRQVRVAALARLHLDNFPHLRMLVNYTTTRSACAASATPSISGSTRSRPPRSSSSRAARASASRSACGA